MPGATARGAGLGPDADSMERIVHDLHGPLTVIRGLCATLARGEVSSDRRRAIGLIDAETLRLAAGLRGLGAPAPGPGPREGEPVDLSALVTCAARRFAPVAATHRARVEARGVHAPVWVGGDGRAIERVIDNLVCNAIRHCPPDGRIELALTSRGGRAVLRVRDDGAGVPPADRERIFRPGDRGSSPRGDGRGLGLAIARDIVRAHGGRLTLDAVGTGACFRLSLPLLGGADRGPLAA
ncbi:MAG: HAMP domain-containing histidine kinase [Thermoleophilia bacterium]|nr:HAMP domain-containing histidine kinase [Thermoleophilia bacterium]